MKILKIIEDDVTWKFNDVQKEEFFFIEAEKVVVYKREKSKNFIIAENILDELMFNEFLDMLLSADEIEIKNLITEFE